MATARLIDDWRTELLRLWSMRVVVFWTVFWSAMGGLILVWPALMGYMPVWLFVSLGVLMCVSFGLARLLKQPGAQ